MKTKIFLPNGGLLMKNFRTYDLAVEFYRLCQGVSVSRVLRDQLDRASSSIVLNLAEGWGRSTEKDRARFYQIALGSLRECQAILDLSKSESTIQLRSADKLGAHIYRLIQKVQAHP